MIFLRVAVFFSAKAGATVAAQMFFRYERVYDEAMSYTNWIHDYRNQVFNLRQNHVPVDSCKAGWACFQLIRQPLDRIVSSYQFVIGNGGQARVRDGWGELKKLLLKKAHIKDAMANHVLQLDYGKTTFTDGKFMVK